MTGPVAFTSSYSDMSNDDGFQWRFRCQRCNTEHHSSFQQNVLSRGRGALRVLRDLFGDMIPALRKASNAAESFSHSRGSASSATRDRAFAAAVDEVQQSFRLCGGCGSWVCGRICWNEPIGQCTRCSPMAAHQIARAQATAREEQIRQEARAQDWTRDFSMGTQASSACSTCGTASNGGRFCHACGNAFDMRAACRGCGHAVQVGSAFCGGCGQPQ